MSTKSALGSTELADVDHGCQRYFYLKHIKGLVPKNKRRGKLLGSLIHVCLRYWYAQFRVGGPPAWWYERSLEDELNRVGAGNPLQIEEAKAIFAEYIIALGDADRAWKVLAIEEEFSIYVAGERVTSRFDTVFEREDGAQFVTDHKSTIGQWGKLPQWTDTNEYGLNWQAYMYLYVAQNTRDASGAARFPRISGFLVTRIKTQRDRTTGRYPIDRNRVKTTKAAFDEIPAMLVRRVAARAKMREQMADYTGSINDIPASFSDKTCWTRYGACDYFDVCRSEDRDRTLAENYEHELEAVV